MKIRKRLQWSKNKLSSEFLFNKVEYLLEGLNYIVFKTIRTTLNNNFISKMKHENFFYCLKIFENYIIYNVK
ncbi:hypothetical protein BpHYR1_016579 [Brachionus plicatilis]|uniref:Uncharacterized protein n=1 Tax=Brachionus plicatilis TaxID=10195 RepID=A0A3M7QMM1_BRAPC|nr:hypothetical protein BpHYR1_016579 [Brachionus plicatilis]